MILTSLGLNRFPVVRTILYFSLPDEYSVAGIFTSGIFSPTGIKSKGGRLISILLRSLWSLELLIQISKSGL